MKTLFVPGENAVKVSVNQVGARLYTAAFAAAMAGMPYRSSFSSAGSAPLSSIGARVAQPASVIWVLLE